jgi:hypothetical protein
MNSPTAGRNHTRLDTLFATVLLVLLATSGAHAQVWTETGDAGDLLATAQSTLGTGTLSAINGNLASSTDVDLYCIRMTSVPPAGLPLLQLQCSVTNGPNVWLLDATGKGVLTNQTCAGGNKTIVAPSVSLAAGTYYVAVSYTGLDPQSASGRMWIQQLLGQRAPDGPGAALPLIGWVGVPFVQPLNPYHLALANMAYCDAAVPTLRSTWSLIKSFYR